MVADWLVAFASGALVAIFAEPIRRRLFGPAPRVEFGADYFPATPVGGLPSGDDVLSGDYDPAYIAVTPELRGDSAEPHTAIYVRLKVTNARGSIAKHCRVHLVKIERKLPSTQRYERAAFYDSVQLAWSSRGHHAFEAIDLPRGVPHFVDVFSTRQIDQGFRLATQYKPIRELGVGVDGGLYRITVMVGGENFRPRKFELFLIWDGRWNEFSVGRSGPGPGLHE